MRWSARSAAAVLFLLGVGSASIAGAVESFLDGNPKAPEAIPYRRVAPTPAVTPAPAPTPT